MLLQDTTKIGLVLQGLALIFLVLKLVAHCITKQLKWSKSSDQKCNKTTIFSNDC